MKSRTVHGIEIFNLSDSLPENGKYVVATRVNSMWYYYGVFSNMQEAIDACLEAHPSYPRMVFYVGA